MRVLIHSSAPFHPGGYGVIAGSLALMLKEMGHEVIFSCFTSLSGAPLYWHDIMMLPHYGRAYGNESLPEHVKYHKPDIVLWVVDAHVLDPTMLAQMAMERPIIAYVPIDHDPLPKAHFNTLSHCATVAYSQWGRDVCRESGIWAEHIPHGIDLTVYSPGDRSVGRTGMQADDDTFVVGMVALNSGVPPRKRHDLALMEFASFHSRHPKSKLYMHCDMTGWPEGMPLLDLSKNLGLNHDKAIAYPDLYHYRCGMIDSKNMAERYKAMDVLLNPSQREGFGLPSLEAQACGVPVILADNTAQPEMCGSGWLMPCSPMWTILDSWVGEVIPGSIEEALEKAWRIWKEDPESWADMKTEARVFAERFSWDSVKAQWKEYLAGAGL